MTVYAADFGPDAIGQTAGVTEYSAAGAVTVARTTSGITHVGNGFFVRDFTPNVSTAALVWDAGGVTASEPIYPAGGGGGGGLDAAGVRAAIGMASANLDAQLDALPTAAENAAATLAAASATPIPADVKKINAVTLTGSGTTPDPMRPA